jgi:hypothetical protein
MRPQPPLDRRHRDLEARRHILAPLTALDRTDYPL